MPNAVNVIYWAFCSLPCINESAKRSLVWCTAECCAVWCPQFHPQSNIGQSRSTFLKNGEKIVNLWQFSIHLCSADPLNWLLIVIDPSLLFTTSPFCQWLIHSTLFAVGLYSGRGVAVGATCYFYCKPQCNNNTSKLVKAELTTLPRPPASSSWRSQNWSRDGKKLIGDK